MVFASPTVKLIIKSGIFGCVGALVQNQHVNNVNLNTSNENLKIQINKLTHDQIMMKQEIRDQINNHEIVFKHEMKSSKNS